VPETDIHNRKQTNQRILVKLEESSLSQENVQEVKEFVNKLKASGIRPQRRTLRIQHRRTQKNTV